MANFTISQEEADKIRYFKKQFYSNLNKISGTLDSRLVLEIQNQQLIIHFSYSSYSGQSTYANCKLKIDCGKKDTYWFQIKFEDLLTGINKFKTGDLTIDYDATTSQIAFISGSRVLTKPAPIWLNEVEAKDIINMLALPEKPIANLSITEDMLNICDAIKSALDVGDSSDAISFDKTIRASDPASIIEYNGKLSTGKQFNLNISAFPLLKKLIGSSVYIYMNDKYHINTPDYDFLWTCNTFNIDLPTEAEEIEVVPDATNTSTMIIKTQDLIDAIKEFNGIWADYDWRWGQVKFQFNKILTMEYEASGTYYLTTCPVKSKSKDMGEFILPTHYLKYLLPLCGEDLILEYNSGPTLDSHCQAVKITSGKLKLLLAKLIIAAR